MNEIFHLKKKLYFVLKIFRFLFCMNPQTTKIMMSSYTLLYIRKYNLECFWWNISITYELLTSNIFSLQFWSLETSSRTLMIFKTMVISWGQFIFSSWMVSILIATVHTFKKTKNLKLIRINFWVIVTSWKLKKGLELGPSFQYQTKKELKMSVVSYTNISQVFILN